MTNRDAWLRGCLWFLALLGILALAALGLFLGPLHKAAAITEWQPSWATMASDWQTVSQDCAQPNGAALVMRCQSGGIVSNKTWSREFALQARVSVSATAISGGRYFAGLTLYDAQSGDTRYGELVLSKMVPPFNYYTSDDAAGSMVDEYLTHWQPIVPGQTYTLQVTWQPSGAYLFTLNGQPFDVAQPYVPLAHDLSIFLLCVSVGEGVPDDGSLAECRFSQLSVTGVESGDVRRVWLPVAAGQGYP